MTKKYLVISAFALLVLTLGYGVSQRTTSPTPPVQDQQFPIEKPSQKSSKGFQTFSDETYNFTISYPNDWEATHSAIGVSSDPLYVIRDEYRFDGSDGEGFHIMTFLLAEGTALRDWVEEYKFPEPEVEIPDEENAVIGGLPAFVLTVPETQYSPPSFWALWVHEGYVLWLEGSLETQTFIQILESLRFEGVETSLTTTTLPELPELKLWK